MADKTFEDYKKQFNDFREHKNPGANLVEISKGMRETFPKNPELRDYFHICYAYWSRAELPMEADDRIYWGEKIKQAFRRVDKLAPDCQDKNRLNSLRMGWNAQLPTEVLYRMANKAEKDSAPDFAEKGEITKIKYQMASRYFADVMKEAEKETNYQKELSIYKKAYNVLFDVKPSARMETYNFLKGKLRNYYNRSEWGRYEGGRYIASMGQKIMNSLPKEIRTAIIRNASWGRGERS